MVKDLLSKKFLILLEIATDEKNLSDIAEKIGITKQGVSKYLKEMKENGLVNVVNGKYKVTVKGIEKIFSSLNSLERYLEEKKKKLNIMKICYAIAGNKIKKGEKVALFMKNGYLYAYSGRISSAYGISTKNVEKGEDVAITGIEGIIELSLGEIYLFPIPSPEKKKTSFEKLRKKIQEIKVDKVGIIGEIGRIAVKKAKIKHDFEFCPVNSAIEAVQKGLKVALIGEENDIRKAILSIEDYNSKSTKEIKYHLLSIS
ncbi:MAG: ArsR family transcriptional regulator [Thermoplasmatales archaeon]|nr:ArsR family transcriptional regulator [Thermoplasmatales archaeon]